MILYLGPEVNSNQQSFLRCVSHISYPDSGNSCESLMMRKFAAFSPYLESYSQMKQGCYSQVKSLNLIYSFQVQVFLGDSTTAFWNLTWHCFSQLVGYLPMLDQIKQLMGNNSYLCSVSRTRSCLSPLMSKQFSSVELCFDLEQKCVF